MFKKSHASLTKTLSKTVKALRAHAKAEQVKAVANDRKITKMMLANDATRDEVSKSLATADKIAALLG